MSIANWCQADCLDAGLGLDAISAARQMLKAQHGPVEVRYLTNVAEPDGAHRRASSGERDDGICRAEIDTDRNIASNHRRPLSAAKGISSIVMQGNRVNGFPPPPDS
ncbi:MAG TPA: hypothetical protein VJ770_10720 [Stellaceae bacterium]|nr:hypothetical protein [Stellaceae bacterium]